MRWFPKSQDNSIRFYLMCVKPQQGGAKNNSRAHEGAVSLYAQHRYADAILLPFVTDCQAAVRIKAGECQTSVLNLPGHYAVLGLDWVDSTLCL